ncbi:hypothetical protein DUI87_30635 [Hirundo rustica rustica]|uniref:RNase H type-1 domain-containing protein n=1 Tax=Hirundo rustica rustica TaxID=333673 RepID=A0A3M0IVR5_HIRRU|nr:hypothetical protein DUI87_30635 [Hirundo rustica rustica]
MPEEDLRTGRPPAFGPLGTAGFTRPQDSLGPVTPRSTGIDFQTKTREDLDDIPLPYGKKLFTDGSSRVIEGKRISGYAIVEAVEGRDLQITEKGKLPSNWSAQCIEVLLTSYTVVWTQEKGWTDITRVKGPVPPPNTGLDPTETSTSLPEWVAIPNSSNLKVTFKRKKPPVG